MSLIGKYTNGNYNVKIYSDGTKIRENNLDYFCPEFPESMDIKITNNCDMMCPYCHEKSTPTGKHGNILNAKFIDTIPPYTELAIGGGNPLSHPNLLEFLEKLKEKNIIANVTVNQKHFIDNYLFLKGLCEQELIRGLGVSYTHCTDELFLNLHYFPNAVLHIINGIVSIKDLEFLGGERFKVLILGYKEFGRGKDYYSKDVENNKQKLYEYLPKMLDKFKCVSFDNLAIKQLDVKRLLTDEEWSEFYMGDDGSFTMYVDMVNEEFAKSSTSTERFAITDNIVDMFNVIRLG
jgi:hypothetical protein